MNANRLKISDFSFVHIYNKHEPLPTGSKTASPAMDMWSAGCVVAELLLRRPLFPSDLSPMDLMKIFQGLEPSLNIKDLPDSDMEMM